MRRHLLAIALIAASLTGCSAASDSCQAERIDVTVPATLTREGSSEVVTLSDQVSPSNVGVPEFQTLRAVLTGDVAGETAGVIWTVPAFAPKQGWVVVAIDAPVAAGEVLPVGSTYGGAGWGLFELPSGTRIAAGLRAGAFVASVVSGTVEVVAVSPLRLRLDLTGGDGTGAEVRVRGVASFSYLPGPPSCT